mgnify:CR=1 FL=1
MRGVVGKLEGEILSFKQTLPQTQLQHQPQLQSAKTPEPQNPITPITSI